MNERPRRELLTNPYRQIEAWCLYYIHSLEYGERNLAALQALYDKAEQYDELAKRHFPPTLREWDPYNIWMDVVLTQFLARYLADLKQRVLHKRRHPQAAVSFLSQISDIFMRFKSEREHLLYAALAPGVDPKARGEFEELLDQAYELDVRIKMARSFRGGNPALSILRDINDGKARDLYKALGVKDRNNSRYRNLLLEPPVYPNYLIHWDETYPTGAPIPRSGVWMPEHDYMPMDYVVDRYVHHPEFGFKKAYHSKEGLMLGPVEYGLISTYNSETSQPTSEGNTHTPTRWTFIEEIPPGTPGIPDNPLRLEHLRAPLTEAPPRRETCEQVVARYRGLYLRTVVKPFLGNK